MSVSARAVDMNVVVQLRAQLYAFPVTSVFEMVAVHRDAEVPGTPAHVRGVINLRGSVLPLVDLRTRLGLPTADHDLNELLHLFDAREQDHRRWIDELDACMRENRPFTLATDPHKCAFGRWFDSLKTDDLLLAAQLKKIDGPHQRIHQKGARAIEALAHGNQAAAIAIAEDVRTHDLAETLRLFEETRRVLRDAQREIAVVIQAGRQRVAVAVDRVIAVESLTPLTSHAAETADAPGIEGALLSGIATRPTDGHMVLRLVTDHLLAAGGV